MANGYGSSYVTPIYGRWVGTDKLQSVVLNVDQFQNFMSVIKKLSDRVEREHDQFLRDSQRLEDRSAIPASGGVSNPVGGDVNFESLVGQGNDVTVKQDTAVNGTSKGWDEDDVWGSIFANDDAVGIDFFECGSSTLTPPEHSRFPRRHCPLHLSRRRRLYRQLQLFHLMQHCGHQPRVETH